MRRHVGKPRAQGKEKGRHEHPDESSSCPSNSDLRSLLSPVFLTGFSEPLANDPHAKPTILQPCNVGKPVTLRKKQEKLEILEYDDSQRSNETGSNNANVSAKKQPLSVFQSGEWIRALSLGRGNTAAQPPIISALATTSNTPGVNRAWCSCTCRIIPHAIKSKDRNRDK
ncbi:hypothetical protein AWENTII_012726 [Aspergillus wentii]